MESRQTILGEQSSYWWQELSEGAKENISIGLNDFEEGRTMYSKEFKKNLATD
ncbi:hypothetical protein [Pricia sp.]|uniref:hypothetical protein n=1 Tax=Pricia sp. TaxID=2268138 RepID=UPI003593E232